MRKYMGQLTHSGIGTDEPVQKEPKTSEERNK